MRLLKFSILLVICIKSPLNSLGQQTKHITGIILSKDTRKPISGATIAIKNSISGVASDEGGTFKLTTELPVTILVSSIGYVEERFLIEKSDSGKIQFYLTPNILDQQEVTVIGSRGKPRTDINRPVPVDIINRKELESTGQIDLAQMLQYSSSSFTSFKTGLNGVANYADPASLKGMSSDQTLVMINGKRRHPFSAISNTLIPGRGSVVTDLNAIPAIALERMEILKDGSAAQYGSDAIAGIVNLILRKNGAGGVMRNEIGITHKGDGLTFSTSINKGFMLGKLGSFLNMTFSYSTQSGTDRSDPYTGTIYSKDKVTDDSIRNVRGIWPVGNPAFVMKYGSNKTVSFQGFFNFAYPLRKNWIWYGFGGSSNKDITAYGFFRTAKPNDPNSSLLYPDGFAPLLPGKTADYSFFTGIEKKITNGWQMDISTGYGYNHLDLYSIHSCNPSLGLFSPTNFYVGRNAFQQSTSEVNFTRSYKNLKHIQLLNLAVGSQFRIDQFQMREGDKESYTIGDLASTQNKASGSSGRPGISIADRTNKTRSNFGSFIDVETDINDRIMFSIAGRYENYNDFGSNFSGKIAIRFNFSEFIALRTSINRGFRAPSLQQIYNRQTTSNAQNGIITQTKQLPADDNRLRDMGIPYPRPELSWNYNFGFVAKTRKNFLMSIDGYFINVNNRIIVSEILTVSSSIPALQNIFPVSSGIREIAFFTNFINTNTKGLDVVSSWKHLFTASKKIQINLSYSINKTTITSQKDPPKELTEGAIIPIKLIDTISQAIITQALPRQKLTGNIEYSLNRLQLNFRISYFGKVSAFEKPPGLPYRFQTFNGKTLCDISVNYKLKQHLQIFYGINNLFNVYPDRVNKNFASYTNGQVPYSRSAIQFGFNGLFMFTGLQLQF